LLRKQQKPLGGYFFLPHPVQLVKPCQAVSELFDTCAAGVQLSALVVCPQWLLSPSPLV